MSPPAATRPTSTAGTAAHPLPISSDDGDGAGHGDLSLGQVEHPRQAVDQREADAQQAVLQPEDDAVEDRRLSRDPQVGPLHVGVASSSAECPAELEPTVLEDVPAAGEARASGTCCSATTRVSPESRRPSRPDTPRRRSAAQDPSSVRRAAAPTASTSAPGRRRASAARPHSSFPPAVDGARRAVGRRSNTTASASRSGRRGKAPRLRLSATDISGNRWRSAGTYASPRREILWVAGG